MSFIYIIVILCIVYFIIANIRLSSFLRAKYTVSNPYNFSRKELIVCSHDYEIIDIFIIIDEIIKYKSNVSIVFDDKLWNHCLRIYLLFIGITNIHFIFTKRKTVQKITQALQYGPVVIYCYRYNIRSGIYYTLKNTNVPLILCTIKGKIEPTYFSINNKKPTIKEIMHIIKQTWNHSYKLNYQYYNYDTNKHNDIFLKEIKNILYNYK